MQLLLVLFLAGVLCASALKIAVVGANGKTGIRCVQIASKQKISVNAVTRNGTLSSEFLKPSAVKVLQGDVRDVNSLLPAFKGVDAVIFAASASKEGGKAAEIDNQGLVNCGIACKQMNVKRIVVVSSGAVSKPYSPVYLFLNLFGGNYILYAHMLI
jgi:uncharacterized protein YbjT (DUF2867 family)